MIPIVLESDVLCDDIDMMYHRCDDSIPAVQHSQQWTVTTGPVGPVAIDNITTTIVLTLRSSAALGRLSVHRRQHETRRMPGTAGI